jgi:HlyD family secretion protein
MKKILLGSALTVILLLTFWMFGYFFGKGGDDGSFETTSATEMNIVQKTVATGSVKPRHEILIKPQISGIIDELFVEAGQIVKKGDAIARIKLVPSPTTLNQAKSNVDLSQLRYQDAIRELERQRKVNKEGVDTEQSRANYDNALKQEQRQKQLLSEGVISAQEYERFKLELELTKNALDNAKINSQNNVKSFEMNVDIRRQELDAAVSNLQLMQEGVAGNTGQVSNIVKATVDGMVLDVPIEVGSSVIERNNFNEGTTIAELADMKQLIFEGKVDESDVGKLKEGMPLLLSIGALDNQQFEAILEYIAPKGLLENGAVKFEIRAALKPKEGVFLRAGYSANADIILARKDKVLAIQERDLIFDEKGAAFVEIEKSKAVFEKKFVKTGISDGINIQITEGLSSKDKIKVQKIQGVKSEE